MALWGSSKVKAWSLRLPVDWASFTHGLWCAWWAHAEPFLAF